MTIAKLNERALLEAGLDRQTVAALRHIIAQVGNEVGATSLPTVATRTDLLDLRASLTEDRSAANSADDVLLASVSVNGTLQPGTTVAGRIIGMTSNGTTPGRLNLWLSVDGAKVFSHAFTTPDVPGANKGFGADFTLTVRAPGAAVAGGVLSLAYNAPTVLPGASLTAFAIPASGATFALGMNWTDADAGNLATAKIAFLSVDKL